MSRLVAVLRDHEMDKSMNEFVDQYMNGDWTVLPVYPPLSTAVTESSSSSSTTTTSVRRPWLGGTLDELVHVQAVIDVDHHGESYSIVGKGSAAAVAIRMGEMFSLVDAVVAFRPKDLRATPPTLVTVGKGQSKEILDVVERASDTRGYEATETSGTDLSGGEMRKALAFLQEHVKSKPTAKRAKTDASAAAAPASSTAGSDSSKSSEMLRSIASFETINRKVYAFAKKWEATGDMEYVGGSMSTGSMAKLAERIESSDIFLDIGHGNGVQVLSFAHLPIRASVGIEKNPNSLMYSERAYTDSKRLEGYSKQCPVGLMYAERGCGSDSEFAGWSDTNRWQEQDGCDVSDVFCPDRRKESQGASIPREQTERFVHVQSSAQSVEVAGNASGVRANVLGTVSQCRYERRCEQTIVVSRV